MLNDRLVLGDCNTRLYDMNRLVRETARSIVEDRRGDAVFEQVLSSRRHVSSKSARNLILQRLQAPDSRLVASLSAFDRIAQDQGIEPVQIGRRLCRVLPRKGSRAVCIFGPVIVSRALGNALESESQERAMVGVRPLMNWACEDVQYVTGDPFELPDFVPAIPDEALHGRLMAYATARRIEVREQGLHGPRGLSAGGVIFVQINDPISLRVQPLIHELAHEALHHSPEGRLVPRHIQEGEAEAVVAVVLRHLGHDQPMSSSYLRNHSVRPDDVLRSMDRIARTAADIIDFVEERD